MIEFLNDFCSEKGMFVLKKTLIRRAGLAFEIYVKDHISCTKFQRSAESPSFCLKLSLSWKREGGERPEEILLRKPWLNDVGNCDPGPRANSILRPTREDCKIVPGNNFFAKSHLILELPNWPLDAKAFNFIIITFPAAIYQGTWCQLQN